ncbi:MAG: hydantoinase/oxoprolinase N-terminal domain-containing protein, partial [Prochlorotrichaceae cyanobacterium]
MTHFFVDRGGTFTDLVALTSDSQVVQRCEADAQFTVFRLSSGKTVILHKLLSENPDRYPDAVIQGLRNILGLSPEATIPPEQVDSVKIGTTVATNALLERKGDPVVLVMTQGLGDALAIGYQNRPDLFALHITKPSLLYTQVIEAHERIDAAGTIVTPLDRLHIQTELQHAYDRGIRSCAIVLMHSYRYPQHEITIAEIAREIGFEQISRSSEVSPLIKYIYRGDTTVVDAYLSPLLRRYVEQVQSQLPGVPLAFMQSHGGLGAAEKFQGRDSILSGPAGGIVGAVKTSQQAEFHKIITFDMGGTSTDVAHFAGEYERL